MAHGQPPRSVFEWALAPAFQRPDSPGRQPLQQGDALYRKLAQLLVVAGATLGLTVTLVAPAGASTSVVQVSSDTLTSSGAQHQSENEPVTAAWGSTIVTTFQVGRFATQGSGAAAVGWATSSDGGATWVNGMLGGITTATTLAGPYDRTVNMTVAYDSTHGEWIIATHGMAWDGVSSFTEVDLLVSRSTDGINWSTPVSVVNTNRPDKSWLTCDNGATSPFVGRCYLVYSSLGLNKRFQMVTSNDGGATWGAPVGTPNSAVGYDVNPVVRPDGRVVVLATMQNLKKVAAFSSIDGGATLTNPVTVSTMSMHAVAAFVRSRSKPSAAVDSAGRVYVTWHDCRFRALCASNDIVLSTSDDAVTWTAPIRVAVDDVTSTVEHFVAAVGVMPGTSGATAQLNVVFYQMPVASCTGSTCAIYAVTASSADGGATWTATTNLNTTAMKVYWLPQTQLGRMLSDYQSIAYVNGVPWAAMAIAKKTAGSTSLDFRQAIYAARLG